MLTLERVLAPLAEVYGEPAPPPARSIYELVLLENVAYLADDARRMDAFDVLRGQIGIRPHELLAASDETLTAVANRGILPENQARKLREIARLTLSDFGDDLESLRGWPLAEARRALMRFPSIGEPGAEKILLFARSHCVLGLESNAVRVLCRLGVVAEQKSYAATYRAVQTYVAPHAARGIDWLIRAHQLLRQHGQTLCKRTTPHCNRCPLSQACRHALNGGISKGGRAPL